MQQEACTFILSINVIVLMVLHRASSISTETHDRENDKRSSPQEGDRYDASNLCQGSTWNPRNNFHRESV